MNSSFLFILLLIILSPSLFAQSDAVTPDRVIAAMEASAGVHPGLRRNHTKGMPAVGSFTATAEAAQYSRSPLFSGKSIPVIARFSLPGGNPKAPDTARSPRGLALQFQLPDASLQHMAMLNTPIFGAATPQSFYESLLAKLSDPKTGKPDPQKISSYQKSHPDARAQAEFLATHNPPAGWNHASYYGIHAFHFINAQNKTTTVRWHFTPTDGEKALTDQELATLPPDFLNQNWQKRLQTGPVTWTLWITIAEAQDPTDDPTLAWPDSRKTVQLGTLTLNAATPEQAAKIESTNFDPMVLSDGIEASADPILRFRSPAYALSFAKRLSEAP